MNNTALKPDKFKSKITMSRVTRQHANIEQAKITHVHSCRKIPPPQKRRKLEYDGGELADQWFMYQQAKIKSEKERNNIEEFLEVEDDLKSRRIMAFKYNYALDEVTQNFTSFHAYL